MKSRLKLLGIVVILGAIFAMATTVLAAPPDPLIGPRPRQTPSTMTAASRT